jgi:hypothetical protein
MKQNLDHLAEYSALYTVLVTYFFLIVVGVVVYSLGFSPTDSVKIDAATLDATRQPLFWLLILSPFIVVPPVALLTKRLSEPLMPQVMRLLPEIPFGIFMVMSVVCWAYIAYAYQKADVFNLFIAATDSVSSVEMRFRIGAALGLPPFIVLFSLLSFLAVYALTNAIRDKSASWIVVTLLHVLFLFVALTLLNRKWPAVLFVLLLAATFFINARSHRVFLSGTMGILGIVVYLLISVVTYRAATSHALHVPAVAKSMPVQPRIDLPDDFDFPEPLAPAIPPPPKQTFNPGVNKVVTRAIDLAPRFISRAIMRMAIPPAYYYRIFSRDGASCGSIIDGYLKRPGSCQPSYVVYRAIFKDDKFRGTSPSAFHIYEFARDGWLGVALALMIGSVMVGVFSALWNQRNRPLAGAIMVMGVYAAYFLSQLPLEGALVYYHGIAWWAVFVVLLNAVLVYLYRFAGKHSAKARQQGS